MKLERSSCVATDDLALLHESLQNRVDECQRVLNSCEVVSPTQKCVSNINSAHGLSATIVNHCAHEVCPGRFSLYLLAKRILQSDFSGFELRNFCVKLIAVKNFRGDLFLYFLKSLLEGVCHDSKNYTHFEHNSQA